MEPAMTTRPTRSSPLPRSRTAQLAMKRLARAAYALGHLDPSDWDVRDQVPDAWRTLEQDIEVREKKVHLTLRLDESVAKFFRAQGTGYQARINHILATYAQMKIADVDLADRRFLAWQDAWEMGLSEEEQEDAWRNPPEVREEAKGETGEGED